MKQGINPTTSTHFNKFDNVSKKLIPPTNNDYVQNPEYFFYKSKRETFRGINLLNTLTTLKINSEPFFPKEIKKDKKIRITGFNEVNLKKDSKAEIAKENVNETKNRNVVIFNDQKEAKAIEEVKETLTKLQKISIGEIKEYIPKKFKLVSKEKQG